MTTNATPQKLLNAHSTCNLVIFSFKYVGAINSIIADDVLPMSVALAIDVFVNDINPKMVDTPKKIPGTRALRRMRKLISDFLLRAMKNNTIGHMVTL